MGVTPADFKSAASAISPPPQHGYNGIVAINRSCLLYTSDAADERSSVDLGGRRIIKKKTRRDIAGR